MIFATATRYDTPDTRERMAQKMASNLGTMLSEQRGYTIPSPLPAPVSLQDPGEWNNTGGWKWKLFSYFTLQFFPDHPTRFELNTNLFSKNGTLAALLDATLVNADTLPAVNHPLEELFASPENVSVLGIQDQPRV